METKLDTQLCFKQVAVCFGEVVECWLGEDIPLHPPVARTTKIMSRLSEFPTLSLNDVNRTLAHNEPLMWKISTVETSKQETQVKCKFSGPTIHHHIPSCLLPIYGK